MMALTRVIMPIFNLQFWKANDIPATMQYPTPYAINPLIAMKFLADSGVISVARKRRGVQSE